RFLAVGLREVFPPRPPEGRIAEDGRGRPLKSGGKSVLPTKNQAAAGRVDPTVRASGMPGGDVAPERREGAESLGEGVGLRTGGDPSGPFPKDRKSSDGGEKAPRGCIPKGKEGNRTIREDRSLKGSSSQLLRDFSPTVLLQDPSEEKPFDVFIAFSAQGQV